MKNKERPLTDEERKFFDGFTPLRVEYGTPHLRNEQVFAEYLRDEQQLTHITTAWVIWMLGILMAANERGVRLNPEWLRASGKFSHDDEPSIV